MWFWGKDGGTALVAEMANMVLLRRNKDVYVLEESKRIALQVSLEQIHQAYDTIMIDGH
jgi:hypothetical protein